ncbi:MAG: SDR family NAD(P)-dependent oxidoreductase [Alphaproteobacteria bacterium]
MADQQRNILIVGASSSIGTAVIDQFLATGDRVTATFKTRRPDYAAPSLTWVELDVTAADSRSAMVNGALASIGQLDVVVLLAGLLPGKNLPAYQPRLADQVLAVNFTGPALLLQLLLPHLGEGSSIVFMSSVAGQRGSFDPFYAAAKGAVLPFVKSMARALGPRTTINAIAPALIADTSMYHDMAPEVRANHQAQTPTGDFVQIADLAAQIHAITQPNWRSLNGACIDLNGGAYLR